MNPTLLLLLADASVSSVLLNMGLPGVVILGLGWWILAQRTELKDGRAELVIVQAQRVADSQKVTDMATAFTREVTTALNSTTAALTVMRETLNTQAATISDLADAIKERRK